MRGALLPVVLAASVLLGGAAAHAQASSLPGALARPLAPLGALPLGIGPGQQCRAAIRTAERAAGIPSQLMAAIGRVESGRHEPDGSVNPWPWSINAEGEAHVFDGKAEAIAAVRALQAQGMRSIDVGCMQVNLQQHPDAFATLEEAFDPVTNANYAARFLVQLHDETGTWPSATAWYHSATPELGADYQRRVMAVWPEEQQHRDAAPPPAFTSTYASGYASSYASGYASSFVAPGGLIRAGGAPAMPNRAEAARVIPMAAGLTGRSLAAYRAMPIQAAARPLPVVATPRPPANPG
jgi:Transglycosylase SLT domain